MATFNSYAQGTPCWMEYSSDDRETSKTFYGRLFGWDYTDIAMTDGRGEEVGTYSIAELEGDIVAGLGPVMAPGVPASWGVYLAVDDLASTVERAREAGAIIHVEPMDVPGRGRMAWMGDPGGASVGLWQEKGFAGAQRANEPSTNIWNELTVADLDGTARFYADLLGIDVQAADMGPGNPPYTLFEVDGRSVAGTMPLHAGMRPHWNVYFNVENVDVTLARARALGADEYAPSFDVPGVGRMGYLCDPLGASFNLMQDPTA